MKKYKNKYWLYDQYIIQKKSTTEIAKEINCSSGTIWRWLKKFGIKIRTISESQKGRKITWGGKISNTMKGKHLGKENSNWREWDKISKEQKHARMRKKIPKPEQCINCGKRRKLLIANKDHKYTENIEGWMWLCYPCHEKYDRDHNNKNENLERNKHGQFS